MNRNEALLFIVGIEMPVFCLEYFLSTNMETLKWGVAI